jgi:hypothetical protein
MAAKDTTTLEFLVKLRDLRGRKLIADDFQTQK